MLVQVLTGDSWASQISRTMFDPGQTSVNISMFFVTYITFASIVLLNVIIAVLLDEFAGFVAAEQREAGLKKIAQQRITCVLGVLDPLLKTLTSFVDDGDLTLKIDQWFKELDTDQNGGVSFEELRSGIKRLAGGKTLHLTRDEFDVISEFGKHLDRKGEISRNAFQEVIKQQLTRLAARDLGTVLKLSVCVCVCVCVCFGASEGAARSL